ncbi:MAG: 2Fe-2S iron-sulfur cluster-binding protein [Alphaproteobacteria bacterium]
MQSLQTLMPGLAEIAGIVILGGAFVQVTLGAFGSIRRRALEGQRQRLALTLFEERARLDLIATRLERERRELAWEGLRKFRIERKVAEADEICSFYLVPHDRKPIPAFRPGQYLTFQLRIPGQGRPVTRCYSLSDSPAQRDYYRVTIKRLPPPPKVPTAPPGLVSSFFHSLPEGALVDVRAPAGNFCLDLHASRPVVLIAGGVGLTPLVSMLNMICDADIRRETWFFYGVRNRRDHAMYEHLQRLAREHENVRIVVCYSDPTPSCVAGEDYAEKGFVCLDLFKRVLPSSNYEFYICGPPPMMSAITEALLKWGVPEADIHFEAFGPASVKRQADVIPEGEKERRKATRITFARCGKTIEWAEKDGSILDLAQANGVAIDFGCRAGNCGTCETAVREGKVKYLIETGFKPKDGSCLACVAIPDGAVVIDA